ncbi:MAG: response regulator [Magnetococcales bacterium]|nr:response regulator [Magnetococcales bacterium]
MSRSSPRPIMILIVDDVVVNLKLLGQILQDHYQVCFATSGRKALELVALSRPDLVLLDLGLPDMNGIEVCRAIREKPETRELPVIFITGREEALEVDPVCARAWEERIDKPVDARRLLERIRFCLKPVVAGGG